MLVKCIKKDDGDNLTICKNYHLHYNFTIDDSYLIKDDTNIINFYNMENFIKLKDHRINIIKKMESI